MYLVFTRMPGESCRRWVRSLLLYLCTSACLIWLYCQYLHEKSTLVVCCFDLSSSGCSHVYKPLASKRASRERLARDVITDTCAWHVKDRLPVLTTILWRLSNVMNFLKLDHNSTEKLPLIYLKNNSISLLLRRHVMIFHPVSPLTFSCSMPPVSWEPPTQPTGTCGDWRRRGLVHRRRWGWSCWQRWRGSSRMSRGPSSDGQRCWGHRHAMSTTTTWCPWCQRERPAVPRSGPLKCFTPSVKGNVTQRHIQTTTEKLSHCQRECHTAPHSDTH